MINLLNKLIQNRKRELRVKRASGSTSSRDQISKMGKMGQRLVVLSR